MYEGCPGNYTVLSGLKSVSPKFFLKDYGISRKGLLRTACITYSGLSSVPTQSEVVMRRHLWFSYVKKQYRLIIGPHANSVAEGGIN